MTTDTTYFVFYFISSALYALADNSPHESIRRSAHGAIWVIKKAPERPTVQQGM